MLTYTCSNREKRSLQHIYNRCGGRSKYPLRSNWLDKHGTLNSEMPGGLWNTGKSVGSGRAGIGVYNVICILFLKITSHSPKKCPPKSHHWILLEGGGKKGVLLFALFNLLKWTCIAFGNIVNRTYWQTKGIEINATNTWVPTPWLKKENGSSVKPPVRSSLKTRV